MPCQKVNGLGTRLGGWLRARPWVWFRQTKWGESSVMVITLWYYGNTPPPGGSVVAVAVAGCTQVPNFSPNPAVHVSIL